jgi:hypothetical protein
MSKQRKGNKEVKKPKAVKPKPVDDNQQQKKSSKKPDQPVANLFDG